MEVWSLVATTRIPNSHCLSRWSKRLICQVGVRIFISSPSTFHSLNLILTSSHLSRTHPHTLAWCTFPYTVVIGLKLLLLVDIALAVLHCIASTPPRRSLPQPLPCTLFGSATGHWPPNTFDRGSWDSPNKTTEHFTFSRHAKSSILNTKTLHHPPTTHHGRRP